MPSSATCYGLTYADSRSPLPGCAVDAETMTSVACSMGTENVQTVTDVDAPVTRDQILAGLRSMIDQAQPGDSLLFSFAGHGSQIISDAEPYDSVILARDGQITNDEIRAVLADLPAGVTCTLCLDASSSSRSMADLDVSDTYIAGNVVVLSSCTTGESVGHAADDGSPFTNALADVITTHPGVTWADAAALIDGAGAQTASVSVNRAELLYEPAFAPVEDVARDDSGAVDAVETVNGHDVRVEQREGGFVVRSVDTDRDGNPNAVAYSLPDGSTVLDQDVNGDGTLDALAQFSGDGKLTMAAYDADGDGFFETQLHADLDGSVVAVGVFDRDGNFVQELSEDGDGIVNAEADVNGDGSVDLLAGFDMAAMAMEGIGATGVELPSAEF
ncbi:hypothetical protein H9P43_006485 [Blastocladiella emersonii ATCC 22665]|nr:hypothetical protein H9P43_006485 [Blastocladiella emersonii ATCC 22665]